MISAFGINHGDISKMAPKEKRAVATGAGIGAAGGTAYTVGSGMRRFSELANAGMTAGLSQVPESLNTKEFKGTIRAGKETAAQMYRKGSRVKGLGRLGMLTGGVVAGGAAVSAARRKYGK